MKSVISCVVSMAVSCLILTGYAFAGDTYVKGASGLLGAKADGPTSDDTKFAYLGDFWFYDAGSNDDPALASAM